MSLNNLERNVSRLEREYTKRNANGVLNRRDKTVLRKYMNDTLEDVEDVLDTVEHQQHDRSRYRKELLFLALFYAASTTTLPLAIAKLQQIAPAILPATSKVWPKLHLVTQRLTKVIKNYSKRAPAAKAATKRLWNYAHKKAKTIGVSKASSLLSLLPTKKSTKSPRKSSVLVEVENED